MLRKIPNREDILEKRKKLSAKEVLEKSKIICDNAYQFINKDLFQTILCFYPADNEPDLISLYNRLLDEGFDLYFPISFEKGIMDFYKVKSMKDFKPGKYGIMEPSDTSTPFKEGLTCLMFAPGVIFDKKGNRIGHGMGYYDRFLSKYDFIFPVGIGYEFQVVKKLKPEKWDKKMRAVVTEEKIWI